MVLVAWSFIASVSLMRPVTDCPHGSIHRARDSRPAFRFSRILRISYCICIMQPRTFAVFDHVTGVLVLLYLGGLSEREAGAVECAHAHTGDGRVSKDGQCRGGRDAASAWLA